MDNISIKSVHQNEDGSITVEFPDLNLENIEIKTNEFALKYDDTPHPIVNHDWIPVSKNPRKVGYYLVYAPTYGIGCKENREGVMFSRWNGKAWSANRHHCITHWMPIPIKPYTYL